MSQSGISQQSTIYLGNRAMPAKVCHINMYSTDLEHILDSYNSVNTGTDMLQLHINRVKKMKHDISLAFKVDVP